MNQKHILVVDDDPAVVRACATILADEGYQIWATTDGAAALAQLEQDQFDLLLLDLKMPGVDGLTILRRARELDPGATAVLVTGHGSMQSAIEALRAGARDLLLKPFDIDELVETVGRALEDRRREQETLLLQASARENARRYEIATQARQEWETTFDVIDDGIAIVDADLRILRANRSLSLRLQSPSLELVGREEANNGRARRGLARGAIDHRLRDFAIRDVRPLPALVIQVFRARQTSDGGRARFG